jgi:hypothetical protein
VECEEGDREAELHAQESGETRVGGGAAVGVEQLPVLSVWGKERMYAGSGTEVGARRDGRYDAASKPAPSPAARVRHPENLGVRLGGVERCATRRWQCTMSSTSRRRFESRLWAIAEESFCLLLSMRI